MIASGKGAKSWKSTKSHSFDAPPLFETFFPYYTAERAVFLQKTDVLKLTTEI